MDERFSQLIDDVTAGLKDDPELRLDVRTELSGHLQERVEAYAEEGHDAEESAKLAVQSFGSPVEIAGALLEANRRRMKLRALARLLVRALLVPVAVVVAILLGYNGMARVVHVARMIENPSDAPDVPTLLHLPDLPRLLTPKQRKDEQLVKALSTYSESARYAEAKRLWQAHARDADAKSYLGYSTTMVTPPQRQLFLIPPASIGPPPGIGAIDISAEEKQHEQEHVMRMMERYHLALNAFAQEMQTGERVDPSNALYHYKLAEAYLFQNLQTESPGEIVKGYEICDRQLFEQGLHELQIALAKPVLHRYRAKIMIERLSVVPSPQLTEGYIDRLSIISSEIFPEFSRFRELGRKLTSCARVLIAEGRTEEAMDLLANWHRLPIQLLHDSDFYLEVWVAGSIAKELGEETAQIYDSLGRHDLARQVREEVYRLTLPMKETKDFRLDPFSNSDLRRHGSLWSKTVLAFSFSTPPSASELAPSRHHEQTLLNEFGISAVMLMIAVLMLITMIDLSWYFHRLHGATLLLLPSWKESARILGMGVLLPVVIYAIYTQTPFSGREYGILYMLPRFLTEMIALGIVLLLLPFTLARKAIYGRCRRLGVPVPRKVPLFFGQAVKALAGVIGFLLANYFIVIGSLKLANYAIMQGMYNFDALIIAVSLPTLAVGDILFLRWLVYRVKGRVPHEDYALFHGTLARSLVPIYAGAIVVLALSTYPYLIHSEMKALREDKVVLLRGNMLGLSAMESQATTKLKAQMLKAAAEIERGHANK